MLKVTVRICLIVMVALLCVREVSAEAVVEKEYTIQVQTALQSEEIHILERGVGEPRIMIFHGSGAYNHFYNWDPLLSEGKIILVGLPGHGPVKHYSRSHYYRWTIQHFIDVAVKIIKMYNNGHPMILIGHSTGGAVALGVSVQKPELVDRLILFSPTVWGKFKGDSGILTATTFFAPLTRFLVRMSYIPAWKSPLKFCQLLATYAGNEKDFCQSELMVKWAQEQYNYVHKALDLATVIDVFVGVTRVEGKIDLRPMIKKNPCSLPTLIIYGEKDPIIPIKQSKWLVKALPQAELIVIPKLGHLVFIEDEKTLYDKLLPWLKSRGAKE